jgi:integrase/recombinase XerD
MADPVVLHSGSDDLLRVAIAAHLARYKGSSRAHTSSDLQGVPEVVRRPSARPTRGAPGSVEMFVPWPEEIRRFNPSTVSRRLSVVTCFYRTGVIDAVLDASPAAYVRRPPVSSESPTLGLSHLQFEAMI